VTLGRKAAGVVTGTVAAAVHDQRRRLMRAPPAPDRAQDVIQPWSTGGARVPTRDVVAGARGMPVSFDIPSGTGYPRGRWDGARLRTTLGSATRHTPNCGRTGLDPRDRPAACTRLVRIVSLIAGARLCGMGRGLLPQPATSCAKYSRVEHRGPARIVSEAGAQLIIRVYHPGSNRDRSDLIGSGPLRPENRLFL